MHFIFVFSIKMMCLYRSESITHFHIPVSAILSQTRRFLSRFRRLIFYHDHQLTLSLLTGGRPSRELSPPTARRARPTQARALSTGRTSSMAHCLSSSMAPGTCATWICSVSWRTHPAAWGMAPRPLLAIPPQTLCRSRRPSAFPPPSSSASVYRCASSSLSSATSWCCWPSSASAPSASPPTTSWRRSPSRTS